MWLWRILVVLCGISFSVSLKAQENERLFTISFLFDYSGADEVLDYYDWRHSNKERLTLLKGNQLAIATSRLLGSDVDFQKELEALRSGEVEKETQYGLWTAAKRTSDVRTLLQQLKQMQLPRRISATIAAYFPETLSIDVVVPVYVVAFGNNRAAAVVRRVQWEGNRPLFTAEDAGEPVVLINVSRFVETGRDVQAQAIAFISTLAHESFHAVYSILQQSFPDSFKTNTPEEVLLELVHNEGIAYYISLELQRQGRPLSPLWFEETHRAIHTLNTVLHELRSPQISSLRIRELLFNANLSGSFTTNYGVAAGQRMAYEIDTRLGRKVLTQTLTQGFRQFLHLYLQCTQLDDSLPKLDSTLIGRK